MDVTEILESLLSNFNNLETKMSFSESFTVKRLAYHPWASQSSLPSILWVLSPSPFSPPPTPPTLLEAFTPLTHPTIHLSTVTVLKKEFGFKSFDPILGKWIMFNNSPRCILNPPGPGVQDVTDGDTSDTSQDPSTVTVELQTKIGG